MAGGYLPFGFAPSGELTSYTPTLRERATDWLRTKLFSDDRAGQDKANRVMDVVGVTPFGFALDTYDAGREAGMGNYGTAGVMLGMAGLPGPSPKKGIRAFHGSPHDFDRFSMDKIGTGEGAQAYGHGLYFAENENIARSYRDALSPKKVAIGGQMVDSPTFFKAARRSPSVDDNIAMLTKQRENILKEQAQYTSDPELGDFVSELYDQQLKDVDKELAELAQYRGQWFGTRPGGSMYEVEIDADPNAFLDWDKPLSEQPEAVRNAFSSVDKRINSRGDVYTPGTYEDAGDWVKHFQNAVGAGEAQGRLKAAGIPGIKYLDAGSRYTPANLPDNPIANEARKFLDAAQGDADTALRLFRDSNPTQSWAAPERDEITKVIRSAAKPVTRNYVVFDDNLINIIRKYGIAGASAMLGYNILDGMDEAQAAELKRIEGK